MIRSWAPYKASTVPLRPHVARGWTRYGRFWPPSASTQAPYGTYTVPRALQMAALKPHLIAYVRAQAACCIHTVLGDLYMAHIWVHLDPIGGQTMFM